MKPYGRLMENKKMVMEMREKKTCALSITTVVTQNVKVREYNIEYRVMAIPKK